MFQQVWQHHYKLADSHFLFHREANVRPHALPATVAARPFRFPGIACSNASANVAAVRQRHVTPANLLRLQCFAAGTFEEAGSRPLAFSPRTWQSVVMTVLPSAKFSIGQIVKHRIFPFRGVIFDVDPVFNNTEDWWNSIPEEIRPRKDQPFYHLLAENDESEYVAYVSEQNLMIDDSGRPVRHPQVRDYFEGYDQANKSYRLRGRASH